MTGTMSPPRAVRVTVTLDQPVAVGTGPRPDYRSPTFNHIPGAVLRGACAAEWIRWVGAPDPGNPHRAQFLDVFEGEGVFGPLYKTGTYPVPLSVYQHKYAPGERCRRLWWDQAVWSPQERGAGTAFPQTCPDCAQRLEPSKGKPRAKVRELHRTRAALTADGVAREKQLFRTDALARDQVFTGWVSGPAVDAFVLNGAPVEYLWLGGDRSTGGLARVRVEHDVQPDSLETSGTAVVLRLAAPGIFVDAAGLPMEEPDPAELADALHVGSVRVERSWVRWGEVSGWHAASGLPKPTERCVTAGSTYLIRCDVPPSDAALRWLRLRGVGLRRREGFGALCPPMTPPVTLASITGTLAPLRAEDDFAELVRHLRARTPLLEGPLLEGPGTEDTFLIDRLNQLVGRAEAALRILLEMDDVDLYRKALDFLDPKEMT